MSFAYPVCLRSPSPSSFPRSGASKQPKVVQRCRNLNPSSKPSGAKSSRPDSSPVRVGPVRVFELPRRPAQASRATWRLRQRMISAWAHPRRCGWRGSGRTCPVSCRRGCRARHAAKSARPAGVGRSSQAGTAITTQASRGQRSVTGHRSQRTPGRQAARQRASRACHLGARTGPEVVMELIEVDPFAMLSVIASSASAAFTRAAQFSRDRDERQEQLRSLPPLLASVRPLLDRCERQLRNLPQSLPRPIAAGHTPPGGRSAHTARGCP